MMRWTAAALAVAAGLACIAAAPGYQWRLPPGVAPPPVPAANQMSQAKVELGRRLFYDADLSLDGTLSCASCHEQRRAFAEGNATHPGVRGAAGRRNVMALGNVAYLSPLTWADPGQTSLETQVATPVAGEHPVEMGMHGQEAEIARRLSADACYRQMFNAAFPATGGEISFAAASDALAAFERTLVSRTAPYDRGALPPEARQGEAVFKAKGCVACHAGVNFTDGRFHAIAPVRGNDLGAFENTGKPADRGLFRTPSLRNAALTDPYLHDGAARTLAAAILAHDDADLTQDEVAAITTFLDTLTDHAFVTDPRFALPTSFCGKKR